MNGDTDTEEASLPPSVAQTIKVLLERLHALHLQALFEMGSVRVVDRVSAEQLMANFAHVNLVMGEDLNKSLRSLVDTTKGACSGLLADIRHGSGSHHVQYGGGQYQPGNREVPSTSRLLPNTDSGLPGLCQERCSYIPERESIQPEVQ